MRKKQPIEFAARRMKFAAACVLCTCLVSAFGERAGAQELPLRPLALPSYGRSVASVDDSSALVVNPANLAFLPGSELRWTGEFLDETSESLAQGHALGFAVSAPGLPFGVGARMDWVEPPLVASLERFGESAHYQWLTLGMALGGPAASLGISWQRSYSTSPLAHGLSAWTAALSSRPSDYLGFSLLARAFNEPQSLGGVILDPAYGAALA